MGPPGQDRELDEDQPLADPTKIINKDNYEHFLNTCTRCWGAWVGGGSCSPPPHHNAGSVGNWKLSDESLSRNCSYPKTATSQGQPIARVWSRPTSLAWSRTFLKAHWSVRGPQRLAACVMTALQFSFSLSSALWFLLSCTASSKLPALKSPSWHPLQGILHLWQHPRLTGL